MTPNMREAIKRDVIKFEVAPREILEKIVLRLLDELEIMDRKISKLTKSLEKNEQE